FWPAASRPMPVWPGPRTRSASSAIRSSVQPTPPPSSRDGPDAFRRRSPRKRSPPCDSPTTVPCSPTGFVISCAGIRRPAKPPALRLAQHLPCEEGPEFGSPMPAARIALVVLTFLAALMGGAGAMAQSRETDGAADASSLARFVERRAASTTFADLDAFGQAALRRDDREGLNRLYHVAWTLLNQGEFEKAALWNRRLAEAAARQGDDRYTDISHLNELTIRYDQGETGVAREMARIARAGRDWFVRAHAARLTALWLIDQNRTGEALDLLATAEAEIPDKDPFAATAHAGLWEVAGMGLKDLHDVLGATDAFRKFEIDYSNPEYPRPDFDSLYNLARMAVRVGDHDQAAHYYAAHHRLAGRSGLETLKVYDAGLCAQVASARGDSRAALARLEPFGEALGAAAFLALETLPIRAVARAQTGDVAGARRDLARLRGLEVESGVGADSARVEAEVLFAEGRAAEAFRVLRDYTDGSGIQ